MGTSAQPASSFLSRMFGLNQQTQQQVPQTQQMPGMQQSAIQPTPAQYGLPQGSQVPNQMGNNPNGIPQQQQIPGMQQQAPGMQQGQPQQPQASQSPVDALNDLLNNKPTTQAAAPDFFAISPEQLAGISGRAAYGQSIPGQLMQEFAQDPSATLPKILDHVTTSMMRDMVPMISKMTQAGTNYIGQQLRTELPQSIGRQQAVEQIVQQNPMMKPFANMIVSNMQQQNPNMSPMEIQMQAGQLLKNFMDFASQNHTQQTQQQQVQQQSMNNPNSGAETIDWGSLLD